MKMTSALIQAPTAEGQEVLHFAFFFFFFFFWTPYTAKGFKKHFAYFVLHTLPTHAHTHSKPMFGYPQNREELQKKKKKKKTHSLKLH